MPLSQRAPVRFVRSAADDKQVAPLFCRRRCAQNTNSRVFSMCNLNGYRLEGSGDKNMSIMVEALDYHIETQLNKLARCWWILHCSKEHVDKAGQNGKKVSKKFTVPN